jgi:hypothetical protein
MSLRSARFAQQVRLWVYLILLLIIVFQASTGMEALAVFVMFMLIGALNYMEICPVCGSLCWWELPLNRKWPNTLWIGPECRASQADKEFPASDDSKA